MVRQLLKHYPHKKYNNNYQKYPQIKNPHSLLIHIKFCYISGSPKPLIIKSEKHLILIIISLLLLSSLLTSCTQKTKYVGEYKDDKRNVQGTFTHGKWKYEGQKYVGE